MSNPSNEWQDISSAPRKDFVEVLLLVDDSPIIGQWLPKTTWNDGERDGWYDQDSDRVNPTHWTPIPPLPEPPSAAKESEVCGTCGGSKKGKCDCRPAIDGSGHRHEYDCGSRQPCPACQPKNPAAQKVADEPNKLVSANMPTSKQVKEAHDFDDLLICRRCNNTFGRLFIEGMNSSDND